MAAEASRTSADMTGVFLILAVVACLFLRAIYQTITGRVKSQGLALIIVRWLLGRPWHGDALTDAGWKREGKTGADEDGARVPVRAPAAPGNVS